MAGDYTRLTFDPRRDRAMVLEQQGRVRLDADPNEFAALIDRRLRVETYDFAGPAVVPASEPDSFRIEVVGGHLCVLRGRIYVDGLLAENHGLGNVGYEPVWGESIGSDATQLDDQPYLGFADTGAKLVKALRSGANLVYLDVWRREVTAVEDGSIVEPALGVDTCTRVQTVWQIRALPVEKNDARCDFDWSTYKPWTTATAPSAGRLTSWADQPPAPADPCAVAPVGGYRGTENRLYRVEVHDGGGAGEATIKWSRDNGAVATAITGPIANPTTKPIVSVQRLGRDDVLRFAPTDWVELLDDAYELDGKPGLIAQVDSIDVSQNTLMLTAPLSGTIDVQRNPRVRRWDQTAGLTGGVIPITAFGTTFALEDGVNVKLELADPDGAVHTGDWWVFAARAATASIEELDAAPPRGIRHHFARLAIVTAGTVTGDCRVVFPGDCQCEGDGCGCTVCVTPRSHDSDNGPLTIQQAIDQVARTGGRVCLTAGTYVLQRPLQIKSARALTLSGEGSRTVIVYAGEGLGIAVEDSVEVTLERFAIAVARTQASDQKSTPRQVASASDRVILTTSVPGRTRAPLGQQTVAIALVNTADCRVDRCFVVSGFAPGAAATNASINGSLGIGLGGWALRTRLVENVVFGDVAIGDLTVGRAGLTNAVAYDHLGLASGYFASLDLSISDNMLLGLSAGIDFGSLPQRPASDQAAAKRDATLGLTLHVGATRVTDNLIVGPRSVGIAMLGVAGGAATPLEPQAASTTGQDRRASLYPQLESAQATHSAASSAVLLADLLLGGLDRLEVTDNVLDLSGIGIAVSPGNVRIEGNEITGSTATSGLGGGGVLLALGSAVGGFALVADNTIRNVGPFGIAWSGAPGSIEIRGNRLSRIAGYGIAGALSSTLELANIRDNMIDDVESVSAKTAYAIQVGGARVAEVRANTIDGVGTSAASASSAGILVSGCQITQVTDNVLLRVGPSGEHTGVVYGIAYGGSLEALDIRGNVVELGRSTEGGSDVAVVVLGGGSPLAGLKGTEVGSDDHVVVLAEAVQRGNPSVMTPLIERARTAANVRVGARDGVDSDPVPPRAGDVAVVDNVLRTTSAVPLVLIETVANVTFTQNRVARESTLTGTAAVLAVTRGATIVSSNRVELSTAKGAPPAMALFVDMTTKLLPHCTVLGNISSQPIWLNGAPLASPWAELNIVA
jgi:hypothetical protein